LFFVLSDHSVWGQTGPTSPAEQLFGGERGDESIDFGGLPRVCPEGSEVFGVVNCLSDEVLKLFLPAICFSFSRTTVSGGKPVQLPLQSSFSGGRGGMRALISAVFPEPVPKDRKCLALSTACQMRY
jgi:hypothetical protein